MMMNSIRDLSLFLGSSNDDKSVWDLFLGSSNDDKLIW